MIWVRKIGTNLALIILIYRINFFEDNVSKIDGRLRCEQKKPNKLSILIYGHEMISNYLSYHIILIIR